MSELTLPWPSKVLSPNARVHWAVKSKAAKAYRHACYMLAIQAGAKTGIPWEGDVHLWIDYYPPDRRARDQDNMIAASKALFDGLADAYGVNDKRFRLHPYVKDEIGGMIKIRITKGP
ncbi:MAG: RusA family crossover junction endodeoxyribonuclease [Pseudomonadota bacterium]|nr:RusA family crossover junction endodeoxyribonuclease [Pseudomonadota bacterium]